MKVEVLDTQSCPALCNPMNYSLPGSSVHGILHTRKLEWVAIPFSRGSSQPRDESQVSCIAGGLFTNWAMREAKDLATREATRTSLVAQLIKNPPAMRETWVRTLGWEDPLEEERLPTPVFWPGEFHGLYSPWGCKELDMTERLHTFLSMHSISSFPIINI